MSWLRIPISDLPTWDQRLMCTPSANVRQFPFYNEGIRRTGALWVTERKRLAPAIGRVRRALTEPYYLAFTLGGVPQLYVAVVRIGLPPFKLGCIVDGPVVLSDQAPIVEAMAELREWAKHNGFTALRITGADRRFLETLESPGRSEWADGVPIYPRIFSELHVDLSGGPDAVFGRFKSSARRKVKKAESAGYAVTVHKDEGAFSEAWSVLQARSEEKGIIYRDKAAYAAMLTEAGPMNAALLYVARLGESPVAAIMVLRDATTVHYFLGGVNSAAIGDAPSPTVLLQWRAMKHAAQLGAASYNLGTRSGSVYTFKAQFRPTEISFPPPLTSIVCPRRYALWRAGLKLVGYHEPREDV